MTRILVQRGSAGSSSNPNRSSSLSASSSAQPQPQVQVASTVKDEELEEEAQEQVVVDDLVEYCGGVAENKGAKTGDLLPESIHSDRNDDDFVDSEKTGKGDDVDSGDIVKQVSGLRIMEREEIEGMSAGDSSKMVSGSSYPPPPPVPPPKPSSTNSNSRRFVPGSSNAVRIGSSRRAAAWPVVSTRTSPTGSRPSSPRSHCESEGYNSADEQSPCFGSSYDDAERECKFEIDIRRTKGLEVKRMLEDGNCLFRAVADQVYGDSEVYDEVRQMCMDYMERERDHFSQFITEGFTSYCKRKRRDKVYGNNMEIQALSEMYNRPIHIYSYSTEPINIFHRSYDTDTPPVRLRLGFSCLQGRNVDKDQVKAAIKAQQDQQIDNALLAEGRFYSDLELTEKEIERMVMEASRAEYLANDKFKQQLGRRESSTSGAEPSSSGARPSGSETKVEGGREQGFPESILSSSSMQMVLSMGFSYLQVIEAYSIFGDDVDSMSRKDVEGSLFVVKRNTQPRFQFIVMNRRNTDNLVENILGDFEYEVQVPYLLYRNAAQEVNGIWFYNAHECEEVANLFSRILNAYSKVPPKSKVSSAKSEFEELEAVPSMAVMDGPLEPSSSTTSNVKNVPDDPSFVNFFSAAMTIRSASNSAMTGQPYQAASTIPLSHPPSVVPPTIPTIQVPSPPLSASTPLIPLLDTPEPNSSSNHATNLVKPSSFFGQPPSSALMMPPISSSTPTAPPLHLPGNLQRPYGAPLLQPFPPPTPPPSLTPTSVPTPNYGPVINRDKVRDALLILVQDNQFIDMVYRALLNAHNS
ncbi:hypothetical protein F0562_001590 [Nyssa sinensis]|uniref:OTU domain-containing protein n=1 Tax=Nyssa sinensis TaxID=561372 RepID=A0A5J5C4K8_9ASTE|nr:hypothetical protein F0562_001590 [Nyssa sinensis]